MREMKPGFVERASRAIVHKSHKQLHELLNENDMIRMSRVLQADKMLLQFRADSTTAEALVRFWKAAGEKYSLGTAYRDISEAKQIFGSIRFNNKDYERYMLREMIYKWIKVWESEPGKENALNAAVKNLIILGKLDKVEEEGIDRSLLGKHTIIMTDDITEIGLVRDPKIKDYVDKILQEYYTPEQLEQMKHRYKSDSITDITFEEIKDHDGSDTD